jgi:hypothetical protein
LKEVVLCDHPNLLPNIPSPDGININKLGDHGLVISDFCNAAQTQKARRLMKYEIGGNVHDLDCFHHLCNVWIKGVEKYVSANLRSLLEDSLESVTTDLRVLCVYSAIASVWDKFFSLCANYPKGQEEHLLRG